MSRPREPRWSFDELDRFLTSLGYETREQKIEALGIPGKHPDRTWWRWRRDGVPDRGADAVAIHLDTHPALIWPGWSEVDGYGSVDGAVELSGAWRAVVSLLRDELEASA